MDTLKAQQISFIDYSMQQARIRASKEEYKEASIYLSNAIETLGQLQADKNEDDLNNKFDLLKKQMAGDIQLRELLRGRLYK